MHRGSMRSWVALCSGLDRRLTSGYMEQLCCPSLLWVLAAWHRNNNMKLLTAVLLLLLLLLLLIIVEMRWCGCALR